jgi:predicted ester cyclase
VSHTDKQLVLRAMQAIRRGELDDVDQLYHANYVNHEASPGAPYGPDAARHTIAFLHRTFSELRILPLDVIAEEDLVVVRAQASGRQIGEVDGFAPSGRCFSVQHIHVFRVTDDHISEHWAVRDDLGAARQMGLLTNPGEAST